MKLEPDKKNKIPYSVTVTMQFQVYMTRKEEDNGTEIPVDLVKQAVLQAVENGECDIQEDSME